MANNRTFAMIKPTAVKNNHIGDILSIINKSGFKIIALKMTSLSVAEAKRFYAVHEGRDFFEGLTSYMSSGPIVAMILEKNDAVAEFRKLIGPTDPSQAPEGTIRKLFGVNVRQNSVHGSDCDESVSNEWPFFFALREVEN